MKISAGEVERIAELARLRLGRAEIERLRHDLGTILDYMKRLDEVDIPGSAPHGSAPHVSAPQGDDLTGFPPGRPETGAFLRDDRVAIDPGDHPLPGSAVSVPVVIGHD